MRTPLRPNSRGSSSGGASSPGFTLVELLLVVVMLGLATRLVVQNLQSELPRTQVQSVAEALAVKLNFLRAETRLRAQSFGLELDLEQQRYRILIPEEYRVSDEEREAYEDRDELGSLDWTAIHPLVRIVSVDVGTGRQEGAKSNEIRFDPSGRTDAKLIVLGHSQDPELLFSVTVPSIAGQVLVEEGQKDLPKANDYDF